MPGLTGIFPFGTLSAHLRSRRTGDLRRFCFGRSPVRKLSLAPPERDPTRENRFRTGSGTSLSRRRFRRTGGLRGGEVSEEGRVQECISVAVFVHVAELQSGAMNKVAFPGLLLYMTL